ncbi:putative membrane protein YckC [Parelusimicrobium proximum]|uniref:RDD family protein n=1 Tax=Parelusimicrobium proximum TaxID=3228953 RepID=UPI003D165DB8
MDKILIKRLVAYIIDEIIVCIPVQIVAVILIMITKSSIVSMLMNLVLLGALWYYFYFMENSDKFGHQTFGKKIMKIKTVTENGQPLEKKAAMIRAAWKLIGIESVSVFIRKDKKTFHDAQAGTNVVEA